MDYYAERSNRETDPDFVPTKLAVFMWNTDYIIAWDDQGEPGMIVGEPDDGDEEQRICNEIAEKHYVEKEGMPSHKRRINYYYDTKTEAMKVMRKMRKALKELKA